MYKVIRYIKLLFLLLSLIAPSLNAQNLGFPYLDFEKLGIDPKLVSTGKLLLDSYSLLFEEADIYISSIDEIGKFNVVNEKRIESLLNEIKYLKSEIKIQSENAKNNYFATVDIALMSIVNQSNLNKIGLSTNDSQMDALIVSTSRLLLTDLIQSQVKLKVLRQKFKIERELDSILDLKITPFMNQMKDATEKSMQNYLEAAAYNPLPHVSENYYQMYLNQKCVINHIEKYYSPTDNLWLNSNCAKEKKQFFRSSKQTYSDYEIAIEKLKKYKKTDEELFKESAINYLKKAIYFNRQNDSAYYLLSKVYPKFTDSFRYINQAFLLNPNKYEEEYSNSISKIDKQIKEIIKHKHPTPSLDQAYNYIEIAEQFTGNSYQKLIIENDNLEFLKYYFNSKQYKKSEIDKMIILAISYDSVEIFEFLSNESGFDKYLEQVFLDKPPMILDYLKANNLNEARSYLKSIENPKVLKSAFKLGFIEHNILPENFFVTLDLDFSNFEGYFNINGAKIFKPSQLKVLKNEEVTIELISDEFFDEKFKLIIGNREKNKLSILPMKKPNYREQIIDIDLNYEFNEKRIKDEIGLNEIIKIQNKEDAILEENLINHRAKLKSRVQSLKKNYLAQVESTNFYLFNGNRVNLSDRSKEINAHFEDLYRRSLKKNFKRRFFYEYGFVGTKRKPVKKGELIRKETITNDSLLIEIFDSNDEINTFYNIPNGVNFIRIINNEVKKEFNIKNEKIYSASICYNSDCTKYNYKEDLYSNPTSFEKYSEKGELLKTDMGLILNNLESNKWQVYNPEMKTFKIIKFNYTEEKLSTIDIFSSTNLKNMTPINKLYVINEY